MNFSQGSTFSKALNTISQYLANGEEVFLKKRLDRDKGQCKGILIDWTFLDTVLENGTLIVVEEDDLLEHSHELKSVRSRKVASPSWCSDEPSCATSDSVSYLRGAGRICNFFDDKKSRKMFALVCIEENAITVFEVDRKEHLGSHDYGGAHAAIVKSGRGVDMILDTDATGRIVTLIATSTVLRRENLRVVIDTVEPDTVDATALASLRDSLLRITRDLAVPEINNRKILSADVKKVHFAQDGNSAIIVRARLASCASEMRSRRAHKKVFHPLEAPDSPLPYESPGEEVVLHCNRYDDPIHFNMIIKQQNVLRRVRHRKTATIIHVSPADSHKVSDEDAHKEERRRCNVVDADDQAGFLRMIMDSCVRYSNLSLYASAAITPQRLFAEDTENLLDT